MIVVTGAAGFIGSRLVKRLNDSGDFDIILIDDFNRKNKRSNYLSLKYKMLIDRRIALGFLIKNKNEISAIFHLGARTDTTEQNNQLFDKLNFSFSKDIWKFCVDAGIPLIYASSAATYGDGSLGFNDDHDLIPSLKPLNAYGWSKQHFDNWILEQKLTPPKWAGLKFFNVFGPHESHKNKMASVVFHSFNNIKTTGKVQLFKSHNHAIKDGHQSRDFIYIDDIVDICLYCMNEQIPNGIYNAGTGKARTFLDLALATFKAMNLEPNIEFIDTPMEIRETYQYFTEANMTKLFNTGFNKKFISLEEGVDRYVKDYLLNTA